MFQGQGSRITKIENMTRFPKDHTQYPVGCAAQFCVSSIFSFSYFIYIDSKKLLYHMFRFNFHTSLQWKFLYCSSLGTMHSILTHAPPNLEINYSRLQSKLIYDLPCSVFFYYPQAGPGPDIIYLAAHCCS